MHQQGPIATLHPHPELDHAITNSEYLSPSSAGLSLVVKLIRPFPPIQASRYEHEHVTSSEARGMVYNLDTSVYFTFAFVTTKDGLLLEKIHMRPGNYQEADWIGRVYPDDGLKWIEQAEEDPLINYNTKGFITSVKFDYEQAPHIRTEGTLWVQAPRYQ